MKSKSEKVEGELKNALKDVRTRLGLSQNELAGRAGVARQTIGGIEAALYAPSASVALRLARTLGCRVEELFWLEEAPSTLSLSLAESENDGVLPLKRVGAERLLVGKVGDRWVGHQLSGDAAFRSELMPADALTLHTSKGGTSEQNVRLLDSPDALERTVLIAGCSPAISLWTRSAQRWHPGLRPAWIHANSTRALEALARGDVHIAGLHLCDPSTGENNLPFIRDGVKGDVTVINFGVWDEGLMIGHDNPKSIHGLTDLTREGVRIINRESGAGARMLFDTLLAETGVPSGAVGGYEDTLPSHQAVARRICAGDADAGMGTAAMAQIYGLDFLPLRSVRFDLAVRTEFLQEEPVSQLFETLSHKSVRLQLQKLGGYDTTRTGEVMAQL